MVFEKVKEIIVEQLGVEEDDVTVDESVEETVSEEISEETQVEEVPEETPAEEMTEEISDEEVQAEKASAPILPIIISAVAVIAIAAFTVAKKKND